MTKRSNKQDPKVRFKEDRQGIKTSQKKTKSLKKGIQTQLKYDLISERKRDAEDSGRQHDIQDRFKQLEDEIDGLKSTFRNTRSRVINSMRKDAQEKQQQKGEEESIGLVNNNGLIDAPFKKNKNNFVVENRNLHGIDDFESYQNEPSSIRDNKSNAYLALKNTKEYQVSLQPTIDRLQDLNHIETVKNSLKKQQAVKNTVDYQNFVKEEEITNKKYSVLLPNKGIKNAQNRTERSQLTDLNQFDHQLKDEKKIDMSYHESDPSVINIQNHLKKYMLTKRTELESSSTSRSEDDSASEFDQDQNESNNSDIFPLTSNNTADDTKNIDKGLAKFGTGYRHNKTHTTSSQNQQKINEKNLHIELETVNTPNYLKLAKRFKKTKNIQQKDAIDYNSDTDT